MVIPIFKAGDPSLVNNNRPTLPVLSKVLERLMHNRISLFLSKYNILSNNQYGFRKINSTCMALVNVVHKVTYALDNKMYAIGIFLDLSKVYDTVDHCIL